MSENHSKWKIAIDRGGTFTDIVAVDPEEKYHTLKLLSNSSLYNDASIEGIRRLIGLKPGDPLPDEKISGIRFGTTIATNALLEKKGGRVGLVITKGFSDLLAIGYQNRPDIFKLCIEKPPPLYACVAEVDERMDSSGMMMQSIDEEAFIEGIRMFRTHAIDAIAVVCMHSWINPAHEKKCGEILRNQGFSNIYLSHETMNQVKIVSRGQSTVVDAYLSIVLALYLEEIQKETGSIPTEFMQSSGVLTPPWSFKGKNALFSGPAGGVIAVSEISEENDIRSAIGFDMGGTSTDVARVESGCERIFEKEISGIPLLVEMLQINTVAAGGGSLLMFDGQKMLVGPESAGSYPGPACYGFGGPLTVTDANLITGRLIAEYFPKSFGHDKQLPLDAGIALRKFNALTDTINKTLGASFHVKDVANGFLRVANEKMAIAIREISVTRGFDVRNDTLICFGGAGGQHACDIATLLDIEKILIHPFCSVLSAYGIGIAQHAWKTSRTVLMPFTPDTCVKIEDIFAEIEKRMVLEKGLHGDRYVSIREIDLRPQGTETFLTLEYGSFTDMHERFLERYRGLYGFSPDDTLLEVVNLRTAIRKIEEFFHPSQDTRKSKEKQEPCAYQEIHFSSEKSLKAPVYEWQDLSPFLPIRGPACIVDEKTSVIVNPDFEAEMDTHSVITMKRLQISRTEYSSAQTQKPDPVLLEVFHSLFMGVAREMGITLQQTAHSVNMKERLDFSCAVFDRTGNLVANAPHIPVHLGAMSDTVQSLVQDYHGTMEKGDIYIANNPYRGGSHLPDITVVCPVFSEQGEVIFFTASRGHHADIGGITPGSMPAESSHIDEEGVLLDNLILVRGGIFREGALRKVLTNHRYPARNIEERMHDIKAQIASCYKGM
ncbi:MAG: hydantoinase B/oxoprolinase family protein, partial [Thermodesulfovibrionales bacterium]|nr:hydantoinase B/oxoprolinase family protein [Thermodesulfovibrionales bacterium]